ncbi:hypothetical protein FRC12_000521 [Ceratobasidium sp. 428]|nr:hypothetical protein FRC12_000521 [Ceratobasidium sp. 428]
MLAHNGIISTLEDIDSGGGSIPVNFDDLPPPTPGLSPPRNEYTPFTTLESVDLFDFEVWSSSKKDITSPNLNMSRAPTAHTDDPNSSLGRDLDVASLLAGDFDAPATPLIPDQGVATFGNQNPHDDQFTEGFQNATHTLSSIFDPPGDTPSDVITPAEPAPTFNDGVEDWTKLLESIGAGLDSLGLPDSATSATGPVLPGAGVADLDFAEALNSDFGKYWLQCLIVLPLIILHSAGVTASPTPSLNIGQQPDLFGLGAAAPAPFEASVPPFSFDPTLGYVFGESKLELKPILYLDYSNLYIYQ